MPLIVTRPAAQAADWMQMLQALGQPAQALPLLDIAAVPEPAPLRAAWQALAGLDLVMFVSANAVIHFFAQAPAGARWPAGPRAGCTGPGTAAALRAAGVPAAQVVAPAPDAPSFDSEALWALLAPEDWAGRHVLVVRGEEGRNWLADRLSERGAAVDFVAAYRRCAPRPDAAGLELLARALAEPADWLWLFSSSEGVAQLRTLAPDADWSRSSALASHPRIAQTARELGFGDVRLTAPSPTAVALQAAEWSAGQAAG
ncbi:MAG: uroporphyrinogen-III synthase [Leptothrix sp. (in: Bacteria)]|nr:uroporphyrinogen-III synthase [Leptothrix sp. (in: b-proteobacteria)]